MSKGKQQTGHFERCVKGSEIEKCDRQRQNKIKCGRTRSKNNIRCPKNRSINYAECDYTTSPTIARQAHSFPFVHTIINNNFVNIDMLILFSKSINYCINYDYKSVGNLLIETVHTSNRFVNIY